MRSAILLASVLAASAAMAGSGMQARQSGATSAAHPQGTMTARGPAAAPGTGRFAVDVNQDGIITREEAAAMPRLADEFDDIDLNKDGQLDAEEMAQHREKMHEQMRVRAEERWAAADTDGNGSISRAEAEATKSFMAQNFDRLDANSDGQLTREEMAQHRHHAKMLWKEQFQERWTAADQDGDGQIDLAEAQTGLPQLAERFQDFDSNGDGKISLDEMRAHRRP